MIIKPSKNEDKEHDDEWGYLPNEPCRYCKSIYCVYFRKSEGDVNKNDPQVVRCDACGRDWVAESSLA